AVSDTGPISVRAAARCNGARRRGCAYPAHRPGRGRARRRLREPDRGHQKLEMESWPGRPFPLGSMWDGEGTNFSLFSENAERVELCLFDRDGRETRLEVRERTALNWHCYVPGVEPGQCYGYRVHGPYAPEAGHRFNPHKLVLDPYAKAITGSVDWHAANVLPYVPGNGPVADADIEPDD